MVYKRIKKEKKEVVKKKKKKKKENLALHVSSSFVGWLRADLFLFFFCFIHFFFFFSRSLSQSALVNGGKIDALCVAFAHHPVPCCVLCSNGGRLSQNAHLGRVFELCQIRLLVARPGGPLRGDRLCLVAPALATPLPSLGRTPD
jgi:hypothetical protein